MAVVSGALTGGMPAAVFVAMLDMPLGRRISSASGIHPENAAELRAAHAELVRVGEEWRAGRISVASACVTEIGRGSVQREMHDGSNSLAGPGRMTPHDQHWGLGDPTWNGTRSG
ncbi:MAG TPA: hypothetical protein VFP81_09695 [Propionibacteriaceae bacterium]|nr:hypothetical protein [Propionibacteriaceae bacterium]